MLELAGHQPATAYLSMDKRQKKVRRPKQASTANTKLSRFAQFLRREWRRLGLPATNETVVVAVSGGADSVALLLALDELVKSGKLKLKLLVAHLDHKLRGERSKADALWVARLAKELGREITVGRIDVRKQAAIKGDNLEQAARRVRYEFLAKKAKSRKAGIILTAHSMDDQAETVLLNLLRGSGAKGLGGILPSRPIVEGSETLLARPLLQWARRRDTEEYCRLRAVEFRRDEMNEDESFARVRVRRQLLPLMETFNPKIVQVLTGTAELLREDGIALESAATRLLDLASEREGAAGEGEGTQASLRLDLLALAHPALRRRALRQWLGECRGDLKRLERVHILAVEKLLFGERGARIIELPGGSRVSRKRGLLRFDSEKRPRS